MPCGKVLLIHLVFRSLAILAASIRKSAAPTLATFIGFFPWSQRPRRLAYDGDLSRGNECAGKDVGIYRCCLGARDDLKHDGFGNPVAGSLIIANPDAKKVTAEKQTKVLKFYSEVIRSRLNLKLYITALIRP